jgi:hypothetical protein
MSIPNFKNQDDYQEFLNIFDDQWQCKLALLNRVKDDLFPGYTWDQLQSYTLEVTNDIVSNLVYECERQFKEARPEYDTEDEDIFIPRRSFKENVLEALEEALKSQEEKLS